MVVSTPSRAILLAALVEQEPFSTRALSAFAAAVLCLRLSIAAELGPVIHLVRLMPADVAMAAHPANIPDSTLLLFVSHCREARSANTHSTAPWGAEQGYWSVY